MALFEGVSLDPSLRNSIRTFLSSVGGFSQPARKQIRSLQDLLQTIQRFDLRYFRGADLDHVKYVGEGVSYKVSCNKHKGSGELFAVKQVKLPSAATNLEAFERQVACVLRDVEIMSWFSSHENVLNLIGYGWDTFSSGYIPFLVTEYADAGSLRQLLRRNNVSTHEKLVLCRDVLNGLQALHNCGIAHGDLKLDNILAIPWHPETTIGTSSVDFEFRSHQIKACISDFGHALHLIPGNEDVAGWERYGGTLAYNAPELSAIDDKPYKGLDFRKCDIWSLGLLWWEVLRDGKEFFTHWEIQRAVTSTSSLRSSNTPVETSEPITARVSSQLSTCSLVAELLTAAPTFARLACEEIEWVWMSTFLFPRTRERLREMFYLTLCTRPEERAADIASLPFSLSSTAQVNAAPEVSATLLQPSEESSWSFEVFRKLRNLPYEVKQRILSDSKRVASTPGTNVSVAKAAFQAGVACISGFGCGYEPTEAMHWISISASKGLGLARCLLPFFENDHSGTRNNSPTQCFKELLRTSFVVNDSMNRYRGRTVAEANTGLAEFHEDTLTDTTTCDKKVHFELACRSGNVQKVRSLQSIELDGNERDGWSSCPLHWIFMFPEGDIEEMTQLLVSKISIIDLYRNATTSSYILIDPQLPITLSGTPLAFATAVDSVTAVQALLRIGADPFVGNDRESFEGSAWSVACRYHLADILCLFMVYLEEAPYGLSKKTSHFCRLYEYSTNAFSEATPSERIFLHGKRTAEAAEKAALLLLHQLAPLSRVGVPLCFEFENSSPSTSSDSFGFLDCLGSEQRDCDGNRAQDINDCVWGLNQANIVAALCIPLIRSENAETLIRIFEAVDDDICHPRYRRSLFNKLLLHCTVRACSGNLDPDESRRIIQACLDVGAHIDCEEEKFQGSLPINSVIQHGNASMFEWFIQQGADVTAKSARGDTPLHIAISSGFSTVVDLSAILALGASSDAYNEDGISPLHLAIKFDRESDFKEMLDHLVRSGKHPKYQSLVNFASAHPNTEILSYVLGKAKKNLLSPDLKLAQALANAVENERVSNIRVLVSHGAPVSEPLLSSWSCLHMAVFQGSEKSVRELLRADHIEIDRRCALPVCDLSVARPLSQLSQKARVLTPPFVANFTALQLSALMPHSHNCAHILVDAGADVTIESPRGITIAELAVRRPRVGWDWELLAEKLLHKGLKRPLLVLQRAITNRDLEWASFLVMSGVLEGMINGPDGSLLHLLADSYTPTNHEYTPAMYSLTLDMVTAGAVLNWTNKEGYTPLELSVLRNNPAMCDALLKCYTNGQSGDKRQEQQPADHSFAAVIGRADVYLERAWSCAVKSRAWGCVCFFHDAGIKLSTAEFDFDDGCALLQYAFENNRHNTLRLFVGTRGSSDHRDPDWDPRLHKFWQKICIAERVISRCGSRMMDLKIGYTPEISLKRMSDLGYYEAQMEEGFKEVYYLDGDDNPPPDMWDVFDDRPGSFSTLLPDAHQNLNSGNFGFDYSQDEPGKSYDQNNVVPHGGPSYDTEESTDEAIV